MEQGVDINIYERKGFLFDTNFPLDYITKTKITNKFSGDIVFTFENPRIYTYLPEQGFNIGFLVYEFTKLPLLWVENINRYLDLVFVPSKFCKDVFLSSGVDKNKIKVLRYGFNPKYYYPLDHVQYNNDFTFLCIANPHKREGIELLLESFTRAFTKKDKARLILKLTYIPKKNVKSFEYGNLVELCNTYIKKRNSPFIKIIDAQLTEHEIGELYRNSNCYVSLTKAEAFGLCFLEALACGLPVASVKWGGQTDFLNKENAHFIKHTLVPTNGEEYEKINPPGLIAIPSVNHAAKTMYNMYCDRDNYRKHPLLQLPDYFWWSTIAKEFLNTINEDRDC